MTSLVNDLKPRPVSMSKRPINKSRLIADIIKTFQSKRVARVSRTYQNYEGRDCSQRNKHETRHAVYIFAEQSYDLPDLYLSRKLIYESRCASHKKVLECSRVRGNCRTHNKLSQFFIIFRNCKRRVIILHKIQFNFCFRNERLFLTIRDKCFISIFNLKSIRDISLRV